MKWHIFMYQVKLNIKYTAKVPTYMCGNQAYKPPHLPLLQADRQGSAGYELFALVQSTSDFQDL